jgi:hypothetical protein
MNQHLSPIPNQKITCHSEVLKVQRDLTARKPAKFVPANGLELEAVLTLARTGAVTVTQMSVGKTKAEWVLQLWWPAAPEPGLFTV